MARSGLDSVEVGQQVKFAKTVGETDVVLFAGITGDFSDTHINDQYMKKRSNLGGRIAHGALLVGFAGPEVAWVRDEGVARVATPPSAGSEAATR